MEKKKSDAEHCFVLERKEFGETYHVAAACICFPRCRVKLKDATPGQKGFLESLGIETKNETTEDVVADYSVTTRLLTSQEVDTEAKVYKEGDPKPVQEGFRTRACGFFRFLTLFLYCSPMGTSAQPVVGSKPCQGS